MANRLPSLFRCKVLTIDMGQNLCLPNFEAKQPGDTTYYFSPLTILVLLFGVVDNAREFDGARGANVPPQRPETTRLLPRTFPKPSDEIIALMKLENREKTCLVEKA